MPRLLTPRLLPRLTRPLSTTARTPAKFNLRERPAPPRLPSAEQEEYERLQRESTGAFQTSHTAGAGAGAEADIGESELHKDLRRGAKPEFEGDQNPATGEVGGPKNDPLRHAEWTYNGRATDF